MSDSGSSLHQGALEIYRGPHRLRFYRGFGIFCLGHAIGWFGLTYYRGWYKRANENDVLVAGLKALSDKIYWPFTVQNKITDLDSENSSSSNSIKPNVDSYPMKGSVLDRLNPSRIIYSWFPWLNDLSKKLEQNEDLIVPVATFLFGILTLAAGIMFPRRVVRRIILLPSSTTHHERLRDFQLAKIDTYGAFGWSRNGVTFETPLSKVSANDSRLVDQNFSYFHVKGKPFRFFVEKGTATFLDPHEFDFTFALKRNL